MLALLDTDRAQVLDLINAAQRYFEDVLEASAADTVASRSLEDVGNRHRRKVLQQIAARARLLALNVNAQQRSKRANNIHSASTITSSIITDMIRRLVHLHVLDGRLFAM